MYLLHRTHHQINPQNGEGSATQSAFAEQLRNLAIETFPGEAYSRLFAAQPRAFYKKVSKYATQLDATRKEEYDLISANANSGRNFDDQVEPPVEFYSPREYQSAISEPIEEAPSGAAAADEQQQAIRVRRANKANLSEIPSPGPSRADGDKIQHFDKYFTEAINTDVMGLSRLSRRAGRKAANYFDLYSQLLGTRAVQTLEHARSNHDDELEVIVRMLWSWQWALAEKVYPDLLPKAPAAMSPPILDPQADKYQTTPEETR